MCSLVAPWLIMVGCYPQSQLKLDAAAALVEEQYRRKEAAEAEFAAGDARTAEQEAQVGLRAGRGGGSF